jgi:hypothetical protein
LDPDGEPESDDGLDPDEDEPESDPEPDPESEVDEDEESDFAAADSPDVFAAVLDAAELRLSVR